MSRQELIDELQRRGPSRESARGGANVAASALPLLAVDPGVRGEERLVPLRPGRRPRRAARISSSVNRSSHHCRSASVTGFGGRRHDAHTGSSPRLRQPYSFRAESSNVSRQSPQMTDLRTPSAVPLLLREQGAQRVRAGDRAARASRMGEQSPASAAVAGRRVAVKLRIRWRLAPRRVWAPPRQCRSFACSACAPSCSCGSAASCGRWRGLRCKNNCEDQAGLVLLSVSHPRRRRLIASERRDHLVRT